ncbi:Tn3 family transposase [Streptomyces sp. NPDC001667]
MSAGSYDDRLVVGVDAVDHDASFRPTPDNADEEQRRQELLLSEQSSALRQQLRSLAEERQLLNDLETQAAGYTGAGIDGSQYDTWEYNLLAESHIRYGGFGGLSLRHVSDTYIALFSHFIPCGMWEAVYLFEGLLKNQSEVTVDIVHGDTQGQSLPVFGLAHMLGMELLPRIRNWKDLTFYRVSATVKYRHIGPLFGDPEKDVINWRLIKSYWQDLMRVALSIRERRLSSAALLRRLGNESRRNRIYQAYRELGRVIRTILSEPELRESIQSMTNKVEAFHKFSNWLMFASDVLQDNDPEHQAVGRLRLAA